MNIRKTNLTDLPVLLKLYENARTFMAEHGNPTQWGTSYPAESTIHQDIENGNSYACEEDGRIVATFCYLFGNDPTYHKIYDGQWLDDEPYGVVHRITSDGSVKGAATFCLNWAFEQCGNLRIDTHEDNTVMQNLLKKNNFQQCGIIYIDDGTARIAYQKNK